MNPNPDDLTGASTLFRGLPNGLAPLDQNGQVPSAFLSSFGKGNLVFDIAAYVKTLDANTDNTVGLNNCIAAAIAVGGEIFISGHCRADGAIVYPNNGDPNFPTQKPLRIFGSNASCNGYWGTPVIGTSVLDLRYNGNSSQVAKIDTRGAGVLEIDHLTIKSGGTDDYQIAQTTNTTVLIHDCLIWGHDANSGTSCVQDFMKWAGTSNVISNGSNAAFQGYGSKMWNNFYHKIQRGSVFGNFVNGIQIENETFSSTCGSSLTHGAPYYFDPGSTVNNEVFGVQIRGGTIEMVNYPYMVSQIQSSQEHLFDSMGFYDPGNSTVAQFYFGSSNCGNSIIIAGFGLTSTPLMNGDATSQAAMTIIDMRPAMKTVFPSNLSSPQITTTANLPWLKFLTTQNGAHSWKWISGYNSADSITLLDETPSNNQRMIVDGSGRVGIGLTPTAMLDTPASSTTQSGFRIRSGTAPTSPNDGDIWYDGANLKIRIGGSTKTFTVT